MSSPQWHPVGRIAAGEAVPFSHVGPLIARPGRSRFPIPGTFLITEVAAALGTPPVGSDVVLDVRVNGDSIYADPAARPRFPADATLALVGLHTPTVVTNGDYLSVDIEQVGDPFPGADLVVNVRLQRSE